MRDRLGYARARLSVFIQVWTWGSSQTTKTYNAIWDGVIGLWSRVAPFLSPWCGKKDVPTGVTPEPVRWSRFIYALA